MKLYFVTGNEKKFQEAKQILNGVVDLEMKNLDLHEIQSLDLREVVEEKLRNTWLELKGKEFIVEDVSLGLKCLNGFPGPLIKWFGKAAGNEKIYKIVERLGNFEAESRVLIGYCDKNGKFKFFEGLVRGKITKPVVKSDFGFDNIFTPDGFDRSYSELGNEEKNRISMRAFALKKLKAFLENR